MKTKYPIRDSIDETRSKKCALSRGRLVAFLKALKCHCLFPKFDKYATHQMRRHRSKETLYLLSVPGMKEKIIEGSRTPIEECENIDDINWEEIAKEANNQANHI
jgi:hypothetical protein